MSTWHILLCCLLFFFLLIYDSKSHILLIHEIDESDLPQTLMVGLPPLEESTTECRIIQHPVVSSNVTFGSNINISIITANCSNIFLNVSGQIIEPSSSSFNQYDLGTNSSILGDRSHYTKAVYSIINASIGQEIQFIVHDTSGGLPLYSIVSTLRVQGPPGFVNDVHCNFISKDILQVSFHEPNNTLQGILTWFSIVAFARELNFSLITNDTTVNVSLNTMDALDLYKAYYLNITAHNSGNSGPTSVCSVFIPNVTRLTNSSVNVSILGNERNAALLMLTTHLLNTREHPLCPGCYPTTVEMYVNIVDGVLHRINFTVPPNMTMFQLNATISRNVHFSAMMYYCNVAGCISTSTEPLSTFDLISVNVAVLDSNIICISCTFAHGSLATGCVVNINTNVDVIINLNSSTLIVNSTVNECLKATEYIINNESHWEAFATHGSTILSTKPAVTGILIYHHENNVYPTVSINATYSSGLSPTSSPTKHPHYLHGSKLIITLVALAGIAVMLLIAVIIIIVFVIHFKFIRKHNPTSSIHMRVFTSVPTDDRQDEIDFIKEEEPKNDELNDQRNEMPITSCGSGQQTQIITMPPQDMSLRRQRPPNLNINQFTVHHTLHQITPVDNSPAGGISILPPIPIRSKRPRISPISPAYLSPPSFKDIINTLRRNKSCPHLLSQDT